MNLHENILAVINFSPFISSKIIVGPIRYFHLPQLLFLDFMLTVFMLKRIEIFPGFIYSLFIIIIKVFR